MHGGLHVEMASFFMSRIVAGLNDGAVNAPGSSAAFLFLVSRHRAGFERWIYDRDFDF
jgi:hypothetical protein